MSLDDRLRQAGGPRGVEDPERVVEGDLLEAQLGTASPSSRSCPRVIGGGRPSSRAGRAGGGAQIGSDDGALECRGSARCDPGDRVEAVEVPAVVAVAVDRRRAPWARSGRSGRRRSRRRSPASSSTRSPRCDAVARKATSGLRDVRHVGDDAVAGLDAEGAQPGRDLARPGREARPSEARSSSRSSEAWRTATLVGLLVAEDVLGEVQLGALEPARAGHRPLGEHLREYGAEASTSKKSQIDAQNSSSSRDGPLPEGLRSRRRRGRARRPASACSGSWWRARRSRPTAPRGARLAPASAPSPSPSAAYITARAGGRRRGRAPAPGSSAKAWAPVERIGVDRAREVVEPVIGGRHVAPRRSSRGDRRAPEAGPGGAAGRLVANPHASGPRAGSFRAHGRDSAIASQSSITRRSIAKLTARPSPVT